MKLRDAKRKLVGSPLEPAARRIMRLVEVVAPSRGDSRAALYDRQTIAVAARVLTRAGDTVDVGAHSGAILEHLVKLAPDGHHVAVEPIPRYARSLQRRFPTVTVHQAALADKPGTATFRFMEGSPEESSLAGHGHQVDGDADTFEVPVLTLDEIAPHRPALVKIDVEGAEHRVFAGGERTLAQRPFVVFELSSGDEQAWETMRRHGLALNLLGRWLDGQEELTRDEFLHAARVDREYVWLAHPVS